MEEQTSANAEEMEVPNTEPPQRAMPRSSGITQESGKKSNRTLKLKELSQRHLSVPADAPAGAYGGIR